MAVLIRAGFRWTRSFRSLSTDISYPQYRPRTGENEITKRKRLLYQSRLEQASNNSFKMLNPGMIFFHTTEKEVCQRTVSC